MIIIPLSTDAPVYHQPRGTFFLIAANVSVYLFQLVAWFGNGEYDFLRSYYIEFGTINPIQWVTSVFLHAGFMHLFGNMIFLWTFGLIVEGKIGTGKFLLIYLLIGTVESAIGQFMMLGGDGYALGASGAIFGIMAVSFVWAPKNDLHVLIIFWILPTLFTTFEVSVLIFCFYMLAWEFILEVLLVGTTSGAQIMSSAFCHLMGAALGGGIAYWMVKSRRVDCEGFDLVSVVAGNEGQATLTLEQEAILESQKRERVEKIRQEHQKAEHFIKLYIEHENPDMAVGRFRALKSLDPSAKWDAEQLSQVIKLFVRQQKWNEACQFLDVFAKQVPSRAIGARLKQAEILIVMNSRPMEGLKILRDLNKARLTRKQSELRERLVSLALQRIEEGDVELAD